MFSHLTPNSKVDRELFIWRMQSKHLFTKTEITFRKPKLLYYQT